MILASIFTVLSFGVKQLISSVVAMTNSRNTKLLSIAYPAFACRASFWYRTVNDGVKM